MLQALLLSAQDQLTHSLDDPGLNDIKKWITDKKFKDSDFGFLNTVQLAEQLHLLARSFYQCYFLKASFSETLQILEVVSELILMGHDEAIFENMTELATWQKNLKSLRYPHTTQTDQLLKTKLESLPWPHGSKIKFERRGDRSGVELKLFITSQADLTKITAALERVKEQL